MRKALFFLLFPLISCFSQEKFTVYFDFDIHELNSEVNVKLSDWIKANHGAEILKMYGYCDSVGSLEYNDRLARQRITSVKKILESNRFRFNKALETKAFGELFEQSVVQGENRKVEIYYQKASPVKNEGKHLSEKISQSKVGDKLRLKNLNFYNRSGRIVPKSIPVLEELFQIMLDNPKLKIAIQGHICCQPQGDLENISTLRCKTVYDYLIQKGIDQSRLSYKGFGSTMPLYPIPEKNEFERDENRRVEIMIVENQ